METVLGDSNKRGRFRFLMPFVEQLPIPRASGKDKKAIETLVQKCLDAKGENCEGWEQEIDERVSKLYGLTDDEIAIVEKSVK